MCKNGNDCIKYFIYFLNACLFILGIAIAGVAGYTAFNKTSVLHHAVVGTHLPGALTGLYIMFAGGLVVAAVSILTCLATSAENKLLLWLTFFLVLLLLIMQLVAIILCFYKYEVVKRKLTLLVRESVILEKLGPSSVVTSFLRTVIGNLEKQNKCCGLNGPSDYGLLIPNSCRPQQEGTVPRAGDAEPNAHDVKRPRLSDEEKAGSAGSQGISPAAAPQPPGTKRTAANTSPSTKETTTTTTTLPPTTTSSSIEPTLPPITKATYAASVAETTAVDRSNTDTTTTTVPQTLRITTAATTAQSNSAPNTTITTQKTTAAAALPAPYSAGCFQRFKPVIYAAGGVGISLLVAEFLLLILIGLMLCEVGKDYERLA